MAYLHVVHFLSMKFKGYIFALISAITYGLIPLFMLPIKAMHFSIDITLFYRFLVAALVLLLVLKIKKESLLVNKRELAIFALLGLLFSFSSDFLFLAYDYLSAGIASTILFVYPVIVALVMAVFFKEKINFVTAIALLITLGGIYVLSIGKDSFNVNFIGLGLALMGAASYALYMVTVNKAKIKASGIKMSFYSLAFSTTYYLIKSLLFTGSIALPSFSLFFDIALFGLITSVISITTLVYAIQYIGSMPTAILGAVEPVVAVMISVMLFGEILTNNLVFGMIAILVGVLINIVFSEKKVTLE